MAQTEGTENQVDTLEHNEDTENMPTIEPEPETAAKRYKTYVLVLGPSGSGKSSLLNEVCDVKVDTASSGMGLCTSAFYYKSFTLGDHVLRLIDTPGFNNSTLSNHQIFNRLVPYLLNLSDRWRHRITGALYLHPAEDDLGSDQLKQNVSALTFLLGKSWLPRLTIAVVNNSGEAPIDEAVLRALKEPTSPFFSAHVARAAIQALVLEPQNIRDLLLRYTKLPPQAPHVQTQLRMGRIRNLSAYIETGMRGRSNRATGPRPPRQQPTSSRLSSHTVTLEESTDIIQKLELALTESQTEVDSLRNFLEQTRSEYASLRSELQLQDNTEQNQLVQSLNDLNRDIENFGRAVAERLVDEYITPSPESGSTTLGASNVSELKIQLGHREGEPSLVMSTSGAGLMTEDFLDLALRLTLCRQLYENVFRPFHPALASGPENRFIVDLYKGIRIQEHQTVSAKWRANAFLALQQERSSLRPGLVDRHVEMVTDNLRVLFGAFFGEKIEIKLTEQEYNCVHQLISSAWDWNQVLKGKVIVLGDFQPVFYPNGSAFDSVRMAEFEPSRSKKDFPKTAICTIALGLIVSRSKVKGDAPGYEVVCKASVVTEHRYD